MHCVQDIIISTCNNIRNNMQEITDTCNNICKAVTITKDDFLDYFVILSCTGQFLAQCYQLKFIITH